MTKVGIKKLLFIFLILSTHLSSFISVLIFKITNNAFAFSIPVINDLLLILLGIVALQNLKIKYLSFNNLLLMLFTFIVLVFNFVYFTQADIGSRLMAFRKIITLILAFYVGLNLYESNFNFKNYLKVHYIIFIPVALFGFLEYFMSTLFWDEIIELPKYWTSKGDLFAATKNTIETSGKFFSYDLFPLIGQKTRRMVSFYTETKPLSSYCIFLVPFALMIPNVKYRKLIILLVISVGLLTYSKGFVLVLMLIFVQRFIRIRPIIIFILFVTFLVLGAIVHKLGIGFGPLSHVEGLYTGFLLLASGNLLGVGLGATGNYTSPLLESLGGGESGFGALLGQIGIGAILIYIFFFKIARSLMIRFHYTNDKVYKVAFICFIGWVINFLYSEAALGFRGNIFVFLTMGLVISMFDKQKYYDDYFMG